ncbi:hypothetical protein C8J57DRAFT_1128816 [Mycena rebaudengoi]|nr:hypothetical protein C8J57DRAFT_1128816 [Mycena rebaudengoi]
MTQKAFSTYIPLVLFPTLSALALKLTFGNLYASGFLSTLEEQCPSRLESLEFTPHRLPYIGVPSIDKGICNIAFFFHLAFTPAVSPYFTYFMGTAMSLLALPALESCRNGRHSALALPVMYGMLMQVMTVGAVLPVYWLIFILTGSGRRQAGGEKTKISQAHAEAVIFGLVIGAAIPSICMIVLQDPYVIVAWQLFPLWQFLAQSAHLLARPHSAHPESGHISVRALYLGAFILASSIHIATLSKAGDLAGVKAIFLPSVVPLTSAAPNLQVLDLFQWDAFFGFASTLLGMVWFATNRRQAVCIALWNIVGSVLVGPGAAIAAVALWREANLNLHSFVKPQSKSK